MPQTLLNALLTRYPTAKHTTLRRMVQARRVRVNGASARTLKQLIGDADRLDVDEKEQAQRPLRPPFRIVHEDDDILVIDKPAGLLTSTVPREKRPTALAIVRKYVQASDSGSQVGLIHRLDADASGLLILSKNHRAYQSLKRQFFHHTVDRVYLALVQGVPNPRQGTIDSRLIERADGTVHATEQPGRGQRAITHYQTLSIGRQQSLLRVQLQTGRKHQIRAQFHQRGLPVVNDRLYGNQKTSGRLMLAAVELAINHPRTERRMTFRINTPEEFKIDTR